MKADCDYKPWLLSAAAVFLFFMGYDFLVHAKWLKPMYDATKHLWRSEAEMKAFFPWCMTPNAVLALLISCAYGCWHSNQAMGKVGSPNCPYRKSMVGFGLWVGLVMGTLVASSYLYLPIPANLAKAWFAAEVGKGIGAGLVLSFMALKFGVCKKK